MNHGFVRFFSDGKSCVVGNTCWFAPFCVWRTCGNIAKCERHGCAQVQYGECHPSVLSPCCVRRIRPSRLMSPNHHRALLAKHHGLTDDEIAIVEGRNETKQEPQGEAARRPAATSRRRRQATTPPTPAPTDDEVLE